MQRIRVLVVDDHRIFAESLAAALTAEADVEVSAVGSGAVAVECLKRSAAEGRPFDVLLVDADLSSGAAPPVVPIPAPRSELTPGQLARAHAGSAPADGASAEPGEQDDTGAESGDDTEGGDDGERAGGIALVSRIQADHPGLRTVVLAEHDDAARAASAIQAGACGWVAKDSSLTRLLHVVRGVMKGETHLPPLLLTDVLEELTASRKHRSQSERLVHSLTPREFEVLRCMVAGLGRRAVAERLYLSPHTVRTHMQNVLGKLGVHSTLAAVALARRAGVTPADTAIEPPDQS